MRGGEIEKFHHVVCSSIASAKRRYLKPYFDEAEDGCEIAPHMRDIVRFHPWRDHNHRYAEPGVRKIARLITAMKHRSDIVRLDRRCRYHVVKETASFIVGQDEH